MITIATRMRAATKGALVPIAEIDFPANARPTHAEKVSELVKSIRLIGLQSMPTVVERDGRYILVAGRHRVEAMRVIGKDPIPVRIADFDEIEARLWTISENLHRNELSALQRGVSVDAPCEPDLPGGAKVVLHTDCFNFAADDPGEQATDALVGQAGQLGASRSWACNPWEPQARAGSGDPN
jgi:ParB-like nuclease domain